MPEQEKRPNGKEIAIFAAVVALIVILLAAVVLHRQLAGAVELLQAYGYLGAFVLGILSSFTLFLPSPAFIAVIGMAAVLDPLLLGIAAGLGSGIGEITAYIVGRGAEAAVHEKKGHMHSQVEKVSKLFKRYQPDLVIFAFAAVPLLPVDIVGIFCGLVKYDWKRFLAVTVVGKIIKFVALAYVGSAALAALGPFLGI